MASRMDSGRCGMKTGRAQPSTITATAFRTDRTRAGTRMAPSRSRGTIATANAKAYGLDGTPPASRAINRFTRMTRWCVERSARLPVLANDYSNSTNRFALIRARAAHRLGMTYRDPDSDTRRGAARGGQHGKTPVPQRV